MNGIKEKAEKLINELRTCSGDRKCNECTRHFDIQGKSGEFVQSGCDLLESDAADMIESLINGALVVDARWKGAGFGDYTCSWCSETISGKTNYCPNCGAKMDIEQEKSKINFQIMQKQPDGKYRPNYEELIHHASSPEEIEYIKGVQARNTDFAFNMVYITKLQCGHYEIFQTPMNEHYSVRDNLKLAAEYAKDHKCTRCVCKW